MSLQLIGINLLAYSLQIALVVAVAAPVPALLAMRAPRARLLFWHVVLAACLLLPLVQPWTRELLTVTATLSDAPVPAMPLPPVAPRFPVERVALWLVAVGAAIRGGWLLLGLVRLRRYRRLASPLETVPPAVADLHLALAPEASLLLSTQVGSPVTFGALHPVVLLPARFPGLEPRVQQAIVCHELLHVCRHDWVFTVAEELVRALFWFHPAVWWLLGKIHLTREQTVDREAIAMTASPHEYVDALLAIAGAKPQLDLAPAPLFLRRRHLKQRVFAILKEGTMSKGRWISALAAGLGVLTVACWLAAAAFPLQASPQTVADADGVTVDLGTTGIIHRDAVEYPEAARLKKIEGTVAVEVSLAADGTVNDAHVISGPEELRRAALQSVLQWHFNKQAASSVRQVSVQFTLPKTAAAAATAATSTAAASTAAVTAAKLAAAAQVSAVPGAVSAWPEGTVLKSIDFAGLAPEAEAELRTKLPVSIGGTVTKETLAELKRTVQEFDSHVAYTIALQKGDRTLYMTTSPKARPQTLSDRTVSDLLNGATSSAPAAASLTDTASGAKRIRVGGNVQQTKLVTQTRPLYPAEAKQARIQGVVKLTAIVDRQGNVANLSVMSGHPLLTPAALEAVRTWTYMPTLLNGEPVEVITQVDVNFTLAQ
jgi:TonB family protein